MRGFTSRSSAATRCSGRNLLLDLGSTFGAGTAKHHLTLYRHASGALVFGAGTAQWSWGLDGTHPDGTHYAGTSAPDVCAQQAMVNLFADMGVLPESLQVLETAPFVRRARAAAPRSNGSCAIADLTAPAAPPPGRPPPMVA